ncbi:Delphilin [Manis pentadactyla]|nr:Delphilin [Manis pentadactyla]
MPHLFNYLNNIKVSIFSRPGPVLGQDEERGEIRGSWLTWVGVLNQERRTRKKAWKGGQLRAVLLCPHFPPGSLVGPRGATSTTTPPHPKDLAEIRPSLKRRELWFGLRIFILENKESSGLEKTFEEEAKTPALRSGLCVDLHELEMVCVCEHLVTLASSKWNDEVLPGISDSPQNERGELLEDVLCCWNGLQMPVSQHEWQVFQKLMAPAVSPVETEADLNRLMSGQEGVSNEKLHHALNTTTLLMNTLLLINSGELSEHQLMLWYLVGPPSGPGICRGLERLLELPVVRQQDPNTLNQAHAPCLFKTERWVSRQLR